MLMSYSTPLVLGAWGSLATNKYILIRGLESANVEHLGVSAQVRHFSLPLLANLYQVRSVEPSIRTSYVTMVRARDTVIQSELCSTIWREGDVTVSSWHLSLRPHNRPVLTRSACPTTPLVAVVLETVWRIRPACGSLCVLSKRCTESVSS